MVSAMTPPHAHPPLPVPEDIEDVPGYTPDYGLLSELMSAALDGCVPCQSRMLGRLETDSTSSARLVALACVAIHDLLGGLPAAMTDPDAPGVAHPAFRRLATAGLDGHPEAMFVLAATMGPGELRGASETALDLLVGHLG